MVGEEERAREKEWKIKRKMKGRLGEDKSSMVKMTKKINEKNWSIIGPGRRRESMKADEAHESAP